MKRLSLTVASWADRDDLIIEIDHGNEQVGLVTYDASLGKPTIELYPRLSDMEWSFELDELNAILAMARDRIVEVAGPEAREAMLAAQRDHAPAVGYKSSIQELSVLYRFGTLRRFSPPVGRSGCVL